MQYEASFVHPVKNVFQPPKKKIAFNESLKSNDGLLIHEIQVGEAISIQEAKSIVENFVQNLVLELKEKDQLTLDLIGTFQLDKEQNIQFEADSKANYLDESFGLTELYFKPIIREEEINESMKRVHPSQARQAVRRAPVQKRTKPTSEATEVKEESSDVVDNKEQLVQQKAKVEKKKEQNEEIQKQPNNKNVVFVALPILLLLFAAGSALFLMQNQEAGDVQEASLIATANDTVQTSTTVVEEGAEANSVVEPEVETNVEETVSANSIENEDVEPVQSVEETISSSENRFFIIGGSFEQRSRAEKMSSKVDGSEIIEGNGLYRVSVAGFSSKQEAFSSLDNYKGEFGNEIWVLIK